MPNINIQENTTQTIVIDAVHYETETISVSGATSLAAGTVLGRTIGGSVLVPYDPAAADGSNVPVALLTADVEFDDGVAFQHSVLWAGTVRLDRLVVASGAALPTFFRDQFKSAGIIATTTQQLSSFDNNNGGA